LALRSAAGLPVTAILIRTELCAENMLFRPFVHGILVVHRLARRLVISTSLVYQNADAVADDLPASAVSFALITAFFGVMFALFPNPLPTQAGIAKTPWWAVIGGLVGAVQVYAGLTLSGGNKSKAAELLGIHRRFLYEKLREYGLTPGGA
jgi:Bacterial regulatory protein, Fis family/Putative inner membrane exporter, YdcZ